MFLKRLRLLDVSVSSRLQFFIVPLGMGPTLITTGFSFVVCSLCGFAGLLFYCCCFSLEIPLFTQVKSQTGISSNDRCLGLKLEESEGLFRHILVSKKILQTPFKLPL